MALHASSHILLVVQRQQSACMLNRADEWS
uniref:Uncharacterized protein n=1 Tax=Arundo donax TaxID=35708 RepID=A0A0A9ACE3_ARUDO